MKRSMAIAKTTFNFKTSMRVVKQKVIRLEVVVEQMEALDKGKVIVIKR
jgi:hypothetical protein